MKKLIAVILSFVASALILTGCNTNSDDTVSDDASNSGDTKIKVAVTIVPEATFVEKVGGELVDIVTIVPPGQSPETYEPSPQEMLAFDEADIYFSIGVEIEEAAVLPKIKNQKVVSLEEAVAEVYPDVKFDDGGRDPHIWLSPKRVKVMVSTIAEELGKLDPDNAQTYKDNAEDYNSKLDALDKKIKEELEGIENRKFVVFHPAFGYFADDYGLEMYALEEEGKEATPQHMQEVIDLAKEENIKVIFYQAEIDSTQAQAFAEELGGKTEQLSPLSGDYIENLEKMTSVLKEVLSSEN